MGKRKIKAKAIIMERYGMFCCRVTWGYRELICHAVNCYTLSSPFIKYKAVAYRAARKIAADNNLELDWSE